MIVADLEKKDAAGHEHAKDGKFTTHEKAAKYIAAAHESPQHAKAMTVGDLLKSAEAYVAKSDVVLSSIPGPFVGSFEDSLRRIRGPVCMGSGCEHKPDYDDAGNRIYASSGPDEPSRSPHYLDVVATFPDHAYVRCSDEDRVWKVPYSFDGDSVSTGEPEAVAAQFVPLDEANQDEDDEWTDPEVDDDEGEGGDD